MRILIALIAATIAMASAASAQDTVISAGPLVEIFMPFLMAIISAAVPVLVVSFLQRTRIRMDESNREALQTSLTNAAGLVLQKMAAGASTAKLDVRSPIIAEGVRYVQSGAPDALRKWGITPDDVAEKIVAKIGVLTAPSVSADPK